MINHGNEAVVVAFNISLSQLVDTDRPTTSPSKVFVHQLLPIDSLPPWSSLTLLVYRCYAAVPLFLDRVAIFRALVSVVGDFNIQLDHSCAHNAHQLRLLVDCNGLVLQYSGSTHCIGKHWMLSSSTALSVALALLSLRTLVPPTTSAGRLV